MILLYNSCLGVVVPCICLCVKFMLCDYRNNVLGVCIIEFMFNVCCYWADKEVAVVNSQRLTTVCIRGDCGERTVPATTQRKLGSVIIS